MTFLSRGLIHPKGKGIKPAESKALRALFIFINTNAHTEVLGMKLKASNILE